MLSYRGQGRGPRSHRSIAILRMRDATSNSPSLPPALGDCLLVTTHVRRSQLSLTKDQRDSSLPTLTLHR